MNLQKWSYKRLIGKLKIDGSENWEIESSALCYGGILKITNVYDNSFDFNLTVIHGSHVGDLDGKATILSGNEAQYISNDAYNKDGKCVITFY